MKRILMAAAALGLFAGGAFAEMTDDQEFVNRAASGGLYEIQSSQIIKSDAGADAATREVADKIIADHTKAAADLKAAAAKGGFTVPQALLPKDKAMLDELAGASDKLTTYRVQQVAAHKDAIALHDGYASAGRDADLKAYAVKASPVLKQHLQHVEMLQGADTTATGSTTHDGMKPAQ